MLYLGNNYSFNIQAFQQILFKDREVEVCPEALKRLVETRNFIDYILQQKIKVYGLSTGFADLRNQSIDPAQAGQLSCNLIKSHDTAIGSHLPDQVVLGAMVVRASSLAKGYSGFQPESLKTLISMINAKIIPQVPRTGSLGASGDLAFLSRVARAMMGEEVPVSYRGQTVMAGAALKQENIKPFKPQAKEGLAVTNGTSFMISMITLAYLRELHELENILALQGLFLNAVSAIDAAFNDSIHHIRHQAGQSLIGSILSNHFKDSPFIDFKGVQDDYCIRCVPQIFGPKIETFLEQFPKIERELDAVTDNPLFFKGEEISQDVSYERLIPFNGENWAVLSGGNFHGECLTTIADALCASNVKIALTLERQITYMLNPFRNKDKLPCYLIHDTSRVGLESGYMIAQYTANALAQKISQLGIPTSIFNITSANESEDVVSYGASAAERLLEQVQLIHELNTIYLTVAVQAYSIARTKKANIPSSLLAERLFQAISQKMSIDYPTRNEDFPTLFSNASRILSEDSLREIIGYPLYNKLYKKAAAPVLI